MGLTGVTIPVVVALAGQHACTDTSYATGGWWPEAGPLTPSPSFPCPDISTNGPCGGQCALEPGVSQGFAGLCAAQGDGGPARRGEPLLDAPGGCLVAFVKRLLLVFALALALVLSASVAPAAARGHSGPGAGPPSSVKIKTVFSIARGGYVDEFTGKWVVFRPYYPVKVKVRCPAGTDAALDYKPVWANNLGVQFLTCHGPEADRDRLPGRPERQARPGAEPGAGDGQACSCTRDHRGPQPRSSWSTRTVGPSGCGPSGRRRTDEPAHAPPR